MTPSQRAQRDAENRYTGPIPDADKAHIRALRREEAAAKEAARVSKLSLTEVETEMTIHRQGFRWSAETVRQAYEGARRIKGDQWKGYFGHRIQHHIDCAVSSLNRLRKLSARREQILDRLPVGCRAQAELHSIIRGDAV